MTLLDGKKIAEKMLAELSVEVKNLKARGINPSLAAFNVGEHKPSRVFLGIKSKKARSVGIGFELLDFPENISTIDLIGKIKQANRSTVSAITFQLPLPESLKNVQSEILNSVDPKKDVDLLTEENKDLLERGNPRFIPPTAGGILKLLEAYEIDLSGHSILLVGQGELVGRPLAAILRSRNLSFTATDSSTENIDELIRGATLVITATGVPGLIRPDNVQDGVVIVDAGTAESGDRLVGDVDPEVFDKASFITPIPGGVGPMTVAMLLSNVVEAARGLT